jgi:hypothetical protein
LNFEKQGGLPPEPPCYFEIQGGFPYDPAILKYRVDSPYNPAILRNNMPGGGFPLKPPAILKNSVDTPPAIIKNTICSFPSRTPPPL